MDENVSAYRISIRGKKWWWPILTWIVDAVIHSAWILAGSNLPQLEFKRQIAQTYLQTFGAVPRTAGRPRQAHCMTAELQMTIDRPNFGFRFGFGAERVVFNTFGIVSVSVESNRGTFGNISVSAAVMPNFGSRDAEFRRAPKAGEIVRYGEPLQQVYRLCRTTVCRLQIGEATCWARTPKNSFS